MAGDDLRMKGVLLSGSFPGVSTIQIVQRGFYKASWYILRTECHKGEIQALEWEAIQPRAVCSIN